MKTDQPTAVGVLSQSTIWVSSSATLTLSGPVDLSLLHISSLTPLKCTIDSTGLIIGLGAGQCLISVINPADESHNASTATFTLTILAPTLKIAAIKGDVTHIKVTLNAGVRYSLRTVTIWQKVKGAKKAKLIATVKLSPKGVKALKLVKTKHVTYYVKYKAKVISTLIVK